MAKAIGIQKNIEKICYCTFRLCILIVYFSDVSEVCNLLILQINFAVFRFCVNWLVLDIGVFDWAQLFYLLQYYQSIPSTPFLPYISH